MSNKKRDFTYSSHFGLTQATLASLLGVTRSHFSLFQIGKRDLPADAKLLLAEMLNSVDSKSALRKSAAEIVEEDAMRLRIWERFITENHHQQSIIDRKLEPLIKKRDGQIRLQMLGTQLGGGSFAGKMDSEKVSTITSKALAADPNKYITAIVKLEIKKELLELERQVLERKIDEAKLK